MKYRHLLLHGLHITLNDCMVSLGTVNFVFPLISKFEIEGKTKFTVPLMTSH